MRHREKLKDALELLKSDPVQAEKALWKIFKEATSGPVKIKEIVNTDREDQLTKELAEANNKNKDLTTQVERLKANEHRLESSCREAREYMLATDRRDRELATAHETACKMCRSMSVAACRTYLGERLEVFVDLHKQSIEDTHCTNELKELYALSVVIATVNASIASLTTTAG